MLSLLELKRVARVMREGLLNARLRRIIGLDERALVLTLETAAGKSHLLFSVHPEYARICLVDPPRETTAPSSFCEYVSAHLVGCSLVEIDTSGNNRQMRMNFQSRSGSFIWIYSILGARSNCYLLDASGKLLHSMRPIHETRRELKIGAHWKDPEGSAPKEGEDRWEQVPDALYLRAIGITYAQLRQEREAELMVCRISNVIRKERFFQQRKYANLKHDLEAARKAETYKQKGELLKGVLHKVRAGDTIVWATDYRTGKMVEIPLDPKLSPAANLEAYFERYHKESRGSEIIQRQLEELESAGAELGRTEELLAKILEKKPVPISEIENLASQPMVMCLLRRYSSRSTRDGKVAKLTPSKEIPPRLQPKRYKTDEGLEIWVGRSADGNDYLTTRLARGNDLFFHLEGYPGSHVILRTEGRADPSPASILDACELAVHFSRLKVASSADVHYARVKDVRKPKGAKPGLVYVRGGKTIHLKRDPKRLQSVLANRLDE